MNKGIQVEIYGQPLELGGELDPAYVQRLAEIIDSTMRLLARQTDIADPGRLAILAALNLADELQQLREKLHEQRPALPHEFSRRLEQCTRSLEAALVRRAAQ